MNENMHEIGVEWLIFLFFVILVLYFMNNKNTELSSRDILDASDVDEEKNIKK